MTAPDDAVETTPPWLGSVAILAVGVLLLGAILALHLTRPQPERASKPTPEPEATQIVYGDPIQLDTDPDPEPTPPPK